jgi:hypothetical protein
LPARAYQPLVILLLAKTNRRREATGEKIARIFPDFD